MANRRASSARDLTRRAEVDVWEDIEARGSRVEDRDRRAESEPAWRRAALEALADEKFDILIVGGGIVGVGALP